MEENGIEPKGVWGEGKKQSQCSSDGLRERLWGRTLREEGELSVAMTIYVRYRRRNGRRRLSGVFYLTFGIYK